MRITTVVWVAAMLAVPSLAAAHDVLPPSWRGEEGTSRLVYDNNWLTPDEFSSYDGSLAPPEIHYENGWDYWDQPRFGMPGYGWYLPWGYQHQRMIFELDNYDNNNPRKDIRVQVTVYAPDWDMYFQPWSLRVWAQTDQTYGPGMPWDGYFDTQWVSSEEVVGYLGWRTIAFDLSLYPNPDSEIIGLDFSQMPWWYLPNGQWGWYGGYGNVWIDQVVIDTRCVPEPATMSLLGLGALALVRRRRS